MFLVSVHCFVNGAVCKVGWVFWGSQVMLCRMFMELSGINAVSAGFTVNSSWPQQQSGAGIRILAGGDRSASIGLWQEFVSGNYFCCTAGFLAPIRSRKVLGSPCKGEQGDVSRGPSMQRWQAQSWPGGSTPGAACASDKALHSKLMACFWLKYGGAQRQLPCRRKAA